MLHPISIFNGANNKHEPLFYWREGQSIQIYTPLYDSKWLHDSESYKTQFKGSETKNNILRVLRVYSFRHLMMRKLKNQTDSFM